MKIPSQLRLVLFKILGAGNVDRLRYSKFSSKFGKFLKYKDKEMFIRKFSEFYEPEMALIPRILNDPKVIVDIGANYGPYSFFLSKIYSQAKIFAFEPATRSYNILKKIIKRFGLENVIPVKRGLGSTEETKEICMPMQYTILAYILDKNAQKGKKDITEEIKVVTLDNFVKRNNIPKIDFIKCDVEGFEFEVFKGAINTLKIHKPTVLVEIEERHTNKYGINPQEIIDFFKKINYDCYSVKNDGLIKTNAVAKEIPLYLFVPKIKIN